MFAMLKRYKDSSESIKFVWGVWLSFAVNAEYVKLCGKLHNPLDLRSDTLLGFSN